MRRFLFSASGFLLLVVASVLGLFHMADGYTDAYYVRFTTPRQESLILGTSKAAQGLQPAVIEKTLGVPISNYSFTIHHSSYGPVYLNSIRRKLVEESYDGLFIVTVDPWSISVVGEVPSDPESLPEVDLCLGNTTTVDRNPNLGYLWHNMRGNYSKILFPDRRIFLHEDGWLEARLDRNPAEIRERTLEKAAEYRRRHLQQYRFSQLRCHYLEKTVEELGERGSVYLVRLPVSPEILEVENEAMPDFDKRIAGARDRALGYLDLTPHGGQFTYQDGVHLRPESGQEVSEIVANWISDKERVPEVSSLSEDISLSFAP